MSSLPTSVRGAATLGALLVAAAAALSGAVVEAEPTLDLSEVPLVSAVELREMNTPWQGRIPPVRRHTSPAVRAAGFAVEAVEAPRSVWDDLADCESGDWVRGVPQVGTARWDYGLDFDHGDYFEGGVNFHPVTWDEFRDADMPTHAGLADRAQQIAVAERVLDAQGWGAWPVCSRKLGLR